MQCGVLRLNARRFDKSFIFVTLFHTVCKVYRIIDNNNVKSLIGAKRLLDACTLVLRVSTLSTICFPYFIVCGINTTQTLKASVLMH